VQTAAWSHDELAFSIKCQNGGQKSLVDWKGLFITKEGREAAEAYSPLYGQGRMSDCFLKSEDANKNLRFPYKIHFGATLQN